MGFILKTRIRTKLFISLIIEAKKGRPQFGNARTTGIFIIVKVG